MFICMCICVYTICEQVTVEAGREHQISWSLGYRNCKVPNVARGITLNHYSSPKIWWFIKYPRQVAPNIKDRPFIEANIPNCQIKFPKIKHHLLILGKCIRLAARVESGTHPTLKLRNQMPKFKIEFSFLRLEVFYLRQTLTMNEEKSLTLEKDIKSFKGVRYHAKLSIAESRLLYSLSITSSCHLQYRPLEQKKEKKSVYTP